MSPEPPKPSAGSLFTGKPITSKRRLSRTRRALYRALAPVLAALVRLLWATSRVRVIGEEHVDAALALAASPIPCFWHRALLPCLGYVRALSARGITPCLLISPSVDGELATRIAERMGARVVRGSATRTGVRAIRDLHKALVKERASPVLPADGPQGPPREFKAGAVMLSQLAGAPILPLACAVRGAVALPTWDRLLLPLPFARVTIAVGEPHVVDRDLPGEQVEAEATRMGARLDALELTAGA